MRNVLKNNSERKQVNSQYENDRQPEAPSVPERPALFSDITVQYCRVQDQPAPPRDRFIFGVVRIEREPNDAKANYESNGQIDREITNPSS